MPRGKQQEETEQDELIDDDEYEYEDDDDEDSTGDIYKQIQEGIISLEADYQRDVVWNDAKQSGLIDSLFRDYYIPPILFAVHEEDDEDQPRTKMCIDGKQRLSSIQRFMDGFIPIKVDGKSWYYRRIGKSTGRLIPEGYRKQFDAKQVLCVEYEELTDAAERDIFQRVQLGMALSEAEKQKAVSSPTATWIRDIVKDHFEGDDGIPQLLPMNMKRSKDFQCFAQFVCMAASLPKFEWPAATKLNKFLREQDERSAPFKSAIEKAAQTLSSIAKSKIHSRAIGVNSIAPVELAHICLLCLILSGRNLHVISTKINEMREFVRNEHIDVRANTRVAKTFAQFLGKLQAPGLPGPEAEWQTGGRAVHGGRSAKKRKAIEVDEDDDDEMDPEEETPVAKVGKAKGRARGKGKAN